MIPVIIWLEADETIKLIIHEAQAPSIGHRMRVKERGTYKVYAVFWEIDLDGNVDTINVHTERV